MAGPESGLACGLELPSMFGRALNGNLFTNMARARAGEVGFSGGSGRVGRGGGGGGAVEGRRAKAWAPAMGFTTRVPCIPSRSTGKTDSGHFQPLCSRATARGFAMLVLEVGSTNKPIETRHNSSVRKEARFSKALQHSWRATSKTRAIVPLRQKEISATKACLLITAPPPY